MPKLNGARPVGVIVDEAVEAPASAASAVAAPVARQTLSDAASARVEAAPARPHVSADHMAFQNADGTVSRVCICACDRCWPPGSASPGPCPDWNDGSV